MKTIFTVVLVIITGFFYQVELSAKSFTAKHNKTIVDSLVQTMDANAQLKNVTSDSVLYDGTSSSWLYEYISFSNDTIVSYFFHTTIDSAVYDSCNNILLVGAAIISRPWINSDSALV